MFLKIRALRETFVTTWNFTGKRFFLSVNSQMVEEVASLSELFQAILAFHYSSDPFCFRVKIFQNLEIFGIRDMSRFTDAMKSFVFFHTILFCDQLLPCLLLLLVLLVKEVVALVTLRHCELGLLLYMKVKSVHVAINDYLFSSLALEFLLGGKICYKIRTKIHRNSLELILLYL